MALLLSDRHHSVGHVPEFCRFPDSPITFVDYKGNGHLKVQGCLYPSALAASREMPPMRRAMSENISVKCCFPWDYHILMADLN